MSNQNPFLTIFTPTYNRAHTLERVYKSLVAQTCQDFEWVVVDDGSSDNTEACVKTWVEEATFPIRFKYQNNAGKHIAWNSALDIAHGDYFVCLDSDDELRPNAVEVLQADLKPKLGTVNEVSARAFFYVDSNGESYGADLNPNDLTKSFVELVYEKKLPSDVSIVFQLSKLKLFPFPNQYTKLYFPEGYIIYAFDKQYPILFASNDKLAVYHRDVNDNLSNSNSVVFAKLSSGSAITLTMMHLAHLNYNTRFFTRYPKKLFLHAIHYNRFRLHTKDCFKYLIREIQTTSGRILASIALLPGILAWMIDKARIMVYRSKQV